MARSFSREQFERALIRRASRRQIMLRAGAGLVAVSLAGRPTRLRGAYQASPVATPAGATPFTLGVASGDPLPDGVVLWTRLAVDPLAEDGLGGMDPAPVEVAWEVAADEAFAEIVQAGTAQAAPELAHSVHVDVTGLEPGREYFYRFMTGGEVSPTGRTKTAPAANATLDRLRFGIATCQDYQGGYFTPYRHMVGDDLDLIVFLGDYIYEYGAADGAPRQHLGGETMTLVDYRLRHALYKTDLDLQAAHAAFPWVVTWDDHEVANDYAGLADEAGNPPEVFVERRSAAYQAYYEHMPLRPESMPQGAEMLLYRRLSYGDLATFQVLDTRQYRTDHPCGAGEQVPCPAGFAEETTMLGPEQERWLLRGLEESSARWNVVAQQVLMGELRHRPAPQEIYWTDSWDGYPGPRARLLNHLVDAGVSNPVIITGDWHCAFVNDIHLEFQNPDSPVVATEFVVTSVSSNGDTTGYADYYGPMVPYNPHIKFFQDRRGYQRIELTHERLTTDLLMVSTVLSEEAPIETVASFVVEDGRPGAQPG